ncbi:MAG: serine/threonine-protein kinase [candidate division Zixibacteria bacterium]
MPDDNDTLLDEGSSQNNPDPLGIIGWVIGSKYKIETYIGGGGFGEVYAGYNQNLTEQRVVVKFFKRVQSREKFDKEARILCQLNHPNICRVLDYLPDEGAAVVAYIDGKDCSKILKSQGALPEKLFLTVARSMSKAVAYAHKQKIAHRDIKPGNILVDKNEHVYLIDFGIAKEIGGDATKTAYTALTPMFAAPERQAGDKNYNPFKSDIYEMGITLFNLATNSLPYRNPVNPIFSEWGGKAAEKLSPELRRILLKATHPDPEKRYQSTADMAADFEELDVAFGSGRKFPTKTVVGALLVIILAIAGWQYGPGLWEQYFAASQSNEQTELAQAPEEKTLTDDGSGDAAETINQETSETAEQISGEKEQITSLSPEEQTAKQDTENNLARQESTEQANIQTESETESIPPQEELKPEEPPPPPPMSRLLVQAAPTDNMVLTIDGNKWDTDRRTEISPGNYELVAMHPDYPLYRKPLRLAEGNENISIDLIAEYGQPELIDMQIAVIPWSEQHILKISFNGRERTFTNFPVLDLRQAKGEWFVSLELIPLSEETAGNINIDSCVTFPHGGGPRSTIFGEEGNIMLGAEGDEQINSVPMVIYWSQ